MQKVIVERSADGKTWKHLNKATGQGAGPNGDVLDLTIPLDETTASRYVQIHHASRQVGQMTNLVEVEIWDHEGLP